MEREYVKVGRDALLSSIELGRADCAAVLRELVAEVESNRAALALINAHETARRFYVRARQALERAYPPESRCCPTCGSSGFHWIDPQDGQRLAARVCADCGAERS